MILKKALGSMLFICPILLSGCSSEQDLTLRFTDEMVIDYASDTDPLSLIIGIGEQAVTADMIENGTLTYSNLIVTCDHVDTFLLGDALLRYTTNDPDQRYITKKIRIADTSAPLITLKDDELILDAAEYASYDFNAFIDVTDNWTDDEPRIDIIIKTKVDDAHYIMQVIAKDIWDNQSSENFDLYLKHPPQDEKEEFDELPENPNVQLPAVIEQPIQNETFDPNIHEPAEEPLISEPPVVNQTPESIKSKEFLFTEGYTISNVSEACHAELVASSKSGSCTPIKGKDGILLGMKLEYYP